MRTVCNNSCCTPLAGECFQCQSSVSGFLTVPAPASLGAHSPPWKAAAEKLSDESYISPTEPSVMIVRGNRAPVPTLKHCNPKAVVQSGLLFLVKRLNKEDQLPGISGCQRSLPWKPQLRFWSFLMPAFLFPYHVEALTHLILPAKWDSLLKHPESLGPKFIPVLVNNCRT